MGEYEDRYPDAYGRNEAASEASQPEGGTAPQPRQAVREVVAPRADWQHAPAQPAPTIEPTLPPTERMPARNHRGVGPRGYVRSPTRIYEDICDRRTDHPLLDASDIEVRIGGSEIVLTGSVESAIAAGRAEAIAREVPGVKAVRNAVKVRTGSER